MLTPAQERGLILVVAASLFSIGAVLILSPTRDTSSVPGPAPIVVSDAIVIASTFSSSSLPDTINVNTAPLEMLVSLPGIGEVLGNRIIAYRKANGSFGSIDELKKISGIGNSVVNNIQDLVTF